MSIFPLLGVRAARKTPLPPASESGSADAEKLRPLKTMTHIAYGLYAAARLFPVTVIAALILGYIKRDEARGTWLESRFAWPTRTFWFMLPWPALPPRVDMTRKVRLNLADQVMVGGPSMSQARHMGRKRETFLYIR
jgi:hypothetical protein